MAAFVGCIELLCFGVCVYSLYFKNFQDLLMYSSWKITQLKEELKKRGASLRGKKADLIERLESYDQNFNFGQAELVDDEPAMDLPPTEDYRDINSNTKLPHLNKTQIRHFLSISDKKMEKVMQLYESRHLVTARSLTAASITYIKGICRKTMKNLHYEVDIKLDEHGSIEEAHCECPAGSGNAATCKHVAVLLLGVEQMVNEKFILLFETCTQRLQTFHAPKKPYSGTPVRAEKLPRKRKNLSVLYEPYPIKNLDKENYNYKVRNLILNYPLSSTMPLKQMYPPANPYGIEIDHDYSEVNPKNKVQQDLQLSSITAEEIQRIEQDTREQTSSEEWLIQRKKRLTASIFHTICHLRPTTMKSFAKQIQDRKQFSSRATTHGIINEKIALEKYCEANDLVALPCGLFVSQERPYLAASPDALLGPETIIEIKCPFASRSQIIDPTTVPYLTYHNNVLSLKPGTPYYYQIQGQLYCSGRKYCNLIVYTYKDMKVVYVYRDESFIQYMLCKLDEFYNYYFKEEIFLKYLYYNYDSYINK